MPRSQAVRAADVQRLLMLVMDVCTGLPDPVQRKQALIGGLCRIFRARIGGLCEIIEGADDKPAKFVSLVDHGWDNDDQRARYLHSLHQYGPNDLMSRRVFARPESAFTHRREDIVEDRLWYESRYFDEVQRPADIDAVIGSYRRFPVGNPDGAPGLLGVGIGLHREANDAPFTKHDVSLLDQVTTIMEHLYPLALADGDEKVWIALSPRLRQVLDGLLQGLGDKDIAQRVGLSHHTIHEYTVDLYRRFNVEGRNALMAKLLRRNNVTGTDPSR